MPDIWHRPTAFFFHAIGDALLALPALRALCRIFSGNLNLICEQSIYKLLYRELPLRNLAIIECQTWQLDGEQYSGFDVERVVSQVLHCDLFLSLVPWRSPSLDRLLRLLCPRLSVGIGPGFDVCFMRQPEKHSFDQNFELPKFFDSKVGL